MGEARRRRKEARRWLESGHDLLGRLLIRPIEGRRWRRRCEHPLARVRLPAASGRSRQHRLFKAVHADGVSEVIEAAEADEAAAAYDALLSGEKNAGRAAPAALCQRAREGECVLQARGRVAIGLAAVRKEWASPDAARSLVARMRDGSQRRRRRWRCGGQPRRAAAGAAAAVQGGPRSSKSGWHRAAKPRARARRRAPRWPTALLVIMMAARGGRRRGGGGTEQGEGRRRQRRRWQRRRQDQRKSGLEVAEGMQGGGPVGELSKLCCIWRSSSIRCRCGGSRRDAPLAFG